MRDPSLTSEHVHRFPIAVVRLRGDLTAADVARAHRALVEALEAEPTSLVIDITGLTNIDDSALAMFPAVAELSAKWPQAQVLLCGASGPVAKSLHRSGVAGLLPLHVNCREAISAAAADPVPRRVHHYLEPTPQAPRAARELAAHACWEWDLPESATSAQVLASELVTNAVRHARTTISFAVTLTPAQLRLSTRDWEPLPVRLQPPTETSQGGRGLLVVDTVASSWGQVSLDGGKVVWAVLASPATPWVASYGHT